MKSTEKTVKNSSSMPHYISIIGNSNLPCKMPLQRCPPHHKSFPPLTHQKPVSYNCLICARNNCLLVYPLRRDVVSTQDREISEVVGEQAHNDITWWDLRREISWQESDQSDNFDRRSKFYEISTTTYIEDKQCTEISAI